MSRYTREPMMFPPGKYAISRLENYIVNEIDECFPWFRFDGPITREQFVSHIVFFGYKNFYKEYANRPRFGERNPGKMSADNSDRRALDREIQAMYKRKQKDEARLENYNPEYRDKVITKEKGESPHGAYHLNDIDLMTLENYSKRLSPLMIVPMLEDGRIVDSKKCSGNNICEAYKEYCEYIKKCSDESDPKDG